MSQVFRVPNVFKSITTTANSNVAAWTPTTGKKFRLMKVWVDVTADVAASAAGPCTISLLEGSTQLGIARSAYVPATAGTSAAYTFSMDLGADGILATTPNAVLNVLLGKALTSGVVRVVVAGVEE